MKKSHQYLVIFLLLALTVACSPTESVPEVQSEATEESVSEEVVTEEATAEETTEEATEEATTEASSEEATVITLMSHDSFNVSEEVIQQFEMENNATVELLPSGDTGSALNQAILSKNNPLADVFFGVDNTFMSRALEADIFEPYESPQLMELYDTLKLDSEYRLLPVDYGDVCLNYDKNWFEEQGIDPPTNLEDLTDPAYEGLTVVENPATSSPGLAFLLTTIGHFGEDNYLDYWQNLRDNDVLVVNGWEEAYWGEFSAASDGERPIVVSYASSPPAEIYFAEEPMEEAPTAAIVADESCFRQIEFIGILKGTEKPELAQKLVDFMLSQTFQEDIPLQMFVLPANKNAELPELFVKYTTIPEETAEVSPAAIEENRKAWIEAWTETVLR